MGLEGACGGKPDQWVHAGAAQGPPFAGELEQLWVLPFAPEIRDDGPGRSRVEPIMGIASRNGWFCLNNKILRYFNG